MRSNTKIDAPEMFLDAALAQFLPDENRTPVEEIVRFMEFIKDVEYRVSRYDPHELSVGVQMPAGEGTISLALRANMLTFDKDANPIPPEQASIDVSAVAMLKALILTAHAVSSAATNLNLAGSNNSGAGSSASNDNSVLIEEHEADTLEVGTWKGQRTFRIRAGWFSQYGAAVYAETLKACGYGDVVELPSGTQMSFKHHITVQVKDGKPKVVKIS